MAEKDGQAAGGTQAIDRAIAILFAFTHDAPEHKMTALSRALNLNKSTVHRLLSALGRAGLVRRNERTGGYRLGPAALDLGARFLGTLDLRTEARPHLERLAREHGESVNLAVLDGGEAISIDYVIGTNSMQVVSKLGQRVPIHCSASGKALVLDLDGDALARLLGRQPYTRYTEHTIVTAAELARQATTGRKQGWAFNDEETELGMRAIGVPVRDHTGAIVACISLSAPSFRMDKARVRLLAEASLATAAAISAAIGGGIHWPPTR
jgi:DNA-binding IclR family transcriptional regulator